MIAVNPNNENSQVQEWNLQLEQQFGSHDVSRFPTWAPKGPLSSYYPYNNNAFQTGAEPSHPRRLNYNNYDGKSNYAGLQAHAEHHQVKTLYHLLLCWGHALDDSTAPSRGKP